MSEHATVFYCKDFYYMLCYDSDIENLATPSRRMMPRNRLKPFSPVTYKADTLNKTYVLRIVYKPVKTTFGRRPDGYVDRYTVVSSEWMRRMGMQFESVFPGGLDDDLLMKARNVEILY